MHSSVPLGSNIIRFDSVDSTNKSALQAAADGAPEGTVFLARSQTKGRGRRSKKWHSPPGMGLYFSVLLRPMTEVSKANILVLQSAVAVCIAIEEIAKVPVGIKWPNDIYMDGKKLGGILLETVISGGTLQHAVVGIGINLNHSSEDYPEELRGKAISINEVTGMNINGDKLMTRILSLFDDYYSKRVECTISMWENRCIHSNKIVTLLTNGKAIRGNFSDVSADLSFKLREESGRMHNIQYGEISLDMEE